MIININSKKYRGVGLMFHLATFKIGLGLGKLIFLDIFLEILFSRLST